MYFSQKFLVRTPICIYLYSIVTVKRVRGSGGLIIKKFAWEHFGMMDDPDYAARATEKLELYAENGFFPGKNLIITMETSAKPLSSKLLKSLIKTYLK